MLTVNVFGGHYILDTSNCTHVCLVCSERLLLETVCVRCRMWVHRNCRRAHYVQWTDVAWNVCFDCLEEEL